MVTKHYNFVHFLGYVRPYTRYLVIAIICGIIKFVVPLFVPQVTKHLLDNVFLNQTLSSEQKLYDLFLYAGGMMAIFLFIYAPAVYVRHLYTDKAGHRAVFDLRCELYYKILRMSTSFFNRNKSGEIVTRLISDIQLAQNIVGSALTNVWMDAIAVLVVLYFLLKIDIATTLVALLTFPVYIFIFRKFSDQIKDTTRRVQDQLSLMSSNAQERISGSVVIQAFT